LRILNSDAGYLVATTYVAERGYRLATLRDSHAAARVEAAAGRRVEGGGYLSLQDDALTLFFDKGVSYGLYQPHPHLYLFPPSAL